MPTNHLSEAGLPGWDDCKEQVYLHLAPNNELLSTFLHHPVSESFAVNYVYADEISFQWVDKNYVEYWGIDEDTFKQQANDNMNRLFRDSTIKTHSTEDGKLLVYYESPIPDLTAALAFCTSLKEDMEVIIGWPVYAVLPARDFIYFFNENDKDDLIPRLGPGVIKEYTESRYPVTTEIIKIGDDGIQAVMRYKI